jgi:hypothetical protein
MSPNGNSLTFRLPLYSPSDPTILAAAAAVKARKAALAASRSVASGSFAHAAGHFPSTRGVDASRHGNPVAASTSTMSTVHHAVTARSVEQVRSTVTGSSAACLGLAEYTPAASHCTCIHGTVGPSRGPGTLKDQDYTWTQQFLRYGLQALSKSQRCGWQCQALIWARAFFSDI